MINSHRLKLAASWWRANLSNQAVAQGSDIKARLRSGNAVNILCEPSIFELVSRLGLSPEQVPRFIQLGQLLAEIKESSPLPLAKALGGPLQKFSSIRFERLLRAQGDDFVRQMRRAIYANNHACNVEQFVGDIFYWGEQTRIRWIYQYFEAHISTDHILQED